MAARIVHIPADAPVIAIYKSGILPEHEGYKYFVPAQSEDQRRRCVKHQLAVDQLECSFFYTSYSQKSLLGLKRGILILFIATLHVYNDITFQTQQGFQRV